MFFTNTSYLKPLASIRYRPVKIKNSQLSLICGCVIAILSIKEGKKLGGNEKVSIGSVSNTLRIYLVIESQENEKFS